VCVCVCVCVCVVLTLQCFPHTKLVAALCSNVCHLKSKDINTFSLMQEGSQEMNKRKKGMRREYMKGTVAH
jgi:hypothetical protein